VRVTTADEMLAAVLPRVDEADYFVATAAVSDWKPQSPSSQKEKKSDGPLTVTFVRTPDVLLTVSERVHQRPRRPVLVGFAAETHDVVAEARRKLREKGLDLIVANDVTAPGAGFGSDTNVVRLLDGRSGDTPLPVLPKDEVADRILDWVAARRRPATARRALRRVR